MKSTPKLGVIDSSQASSAPMMRKALLKAVAIAALVALSASLPEAARAWKAATTPYYMCFAYTQDGMFFAGGDFQLARAEKMTSANCGMPKSIKVVLLKTIMSHDNKTTVLYDK